MKFLFSGTPLPSAKKTTVFKRRVSVSVRDGYKTFVHPRYGVKQTVMQASRAYRKGVPVEQKTAIAVPFKRRGIYFRIFRRERMLLSQLEKCILPRDGNSRTVYRRIRGVYYCTLTYLWKVLTLESDRIRIKWLSDAIWPWLVRWNLRRKKDGRIFHLFAMSENVLPSINY